MTRQERFERSVRFHAERVLAHVADYDRLRQENAAMRLELRDLRGQLEECRAAREVADHNLKTAVLLAANSKRRGAADAGA